MQMFQFSLSECAQFCGCGADRNDDREVLLAKSALSSRRDNIAADKIKSLSPADGFSKLAKSKAQQRKEDDKKILNCEEQRQQPSDENRSSVGGVGIVFQPLNTETLIVRGLRPDSQAALSGLVQVGDKLVSVNNQQVCGMTPKELASALLGRSMNLARLPIFAINYPLIAGPVGTKVMLHFVRGRDTITYPYSIEILRMPICHLPRGSVTVTAAPPAADMLAGVPIWVPSAPSASGGAASGGGGGGKILPRREALAPRSANVEPRRYVSPPAAVRSLSTSFR